MPDAPVIAGPGGEERLAVLGMSADAKGVAMRPDALREDTARKAAKRDRKGEKRLGSGEKQAKKRMAETGAVFDSLPPDGEPRTPREVMRRPPGQPPRTPRAVNKWYTCGITAACAEVIARVFAEADRRDPARERDWLALVDGNAHQISCFQAEAAKRGKDITILIDFIHVIEYLWKAALCFTPPGDTRATEDQVTAWGLDILAGSSRHVAAGIAARAAADPPRPGSEHDKNIRKAIHYLQAKEPFLGLPRGARQGLADRHRHHRRRLPPHRRRPPRHHRSPLEPARRPGHALDARHRRQRRPRPLLELAHRPRAPPQPPQQLQNPPAPQHALQLAA